MRLDDELLEYIELHQLSFPVYADPDFRSIRLLRISGTPASIVISSDSEVVKVWKGAFAGRVQSELEAFFGVSLP